MAQALRRLASDQPLRQSMRSLGLEQARRFSWETSASHAMAAFRKVQAQ